MACVAHDLLCGEFGPRQPVVNAIGEERVLTWKEGASWFRDLMRVDLNGDGKKDNRKLVRKTFYHSVMLKRRLRLRK